MKNLFLLLLIATHLAAGAQHPIVWGEYHPPAVTEEELRSALGVTGELELKPLGGGYSGGLLYTVTLQGKKYVVRRSGGIFGKLGVPQEVAIVEAASRAGIAPKLLYANAATGLLVMEKIDSLLPAEFNPGLLNDWPDLLTLVAAHLRTLRDLKPDPAVVTDRFDQVYFRQWAEKVDRSSLPKEERETIDRLLALPVDESSKVLMHNDLHARNFLFDGRDLFLIDWEIAGWGTRDYDVACFANFQSMSPAQGFAFYDLYLQRTPTEEEAKAFNQLRALHAATRGVYLASAGKPSTVNPLASLQAKSPTVTMRNLLFAIDRERIDFGDPAALHAAGTAWLRWATYLLAGTDQLKEGL